MIEKQKILTLKLIRPPSLKTIYTTSKEKTHGYARKRN